MQNLIAAGFLDSDFDGSSGRWSSDSDIDIDIDIDTDDDFEDDEKLKDENQNESYSQNLNIVDSFGIHSESDDIMKQISMEREYEQDDDEEEEEGEEEEEEEITLNLRAYSILICDEDRESDIDILIGSDYYLTSDINEESEFYHGDIDKDKESEIKTLLFQINKFINKPTIIINNENHIYQIIAECI